MAALGLPPSQSKGNKKALRRIHDMIEGGSCGRNKHGFCDMWAAMSREERIAYFGFTYEQWDSASQFLHIYKDAYRAKVKKRQGLIKQVIGVGLNFIPGVGTALSAIWTAGVTIADGGNVFDALLSAGLAIAGGNIGLGSIGGLPISISADGLSIGATGFGFGVTWDGDPNFSLPLGELGTLSIVDGKLELVLEVTENSQLSIDEDGAELDLTLTDNTQLSLDSDGNADFLIGSEDGNNISINQDGLVSGQITMNGIDFAGDTAGNYNVNFPISDFGNLTFSQNGIGGNFNLGDLGSVSFLNGEISGQLNVGDNLDLYVDGNGVSGSLNLGDLGQINIAADGSVSGNLGIGGSANLVVGPDGKITGSITTEHGTLNIDSEGNVYGELITPNGTLGIDENGMASFTAPPPPPVTDESDACSSPGAMSGSCATNSPGFCFVAGTPVHTQDGLKAIETIAVGDLVSCMNVNTERLEWCEVRKPYIRQYDGTLYRLFFEQEFLETTDEHPFWVLGEEAGQWLAAKDLRVGDILLGKNGETITLSKMETENAQVEVYNLDVDNQSTYSVGEIGITVHNADYEDGVSPTALVNPTVAYDSVSAALQAMGDDWTGNFFLSYRVHENMTNGQAGVVDYFTEIIKDPSSSDQEKIDARFGIEEILGSVGVSPYQDDDGDGVLNIRDYSDDKPIREPSELETFAMSMLPVVGVIMDANDIRIQINEGNYGMAAAFTLMAAGGPVADVITGVGGKIVKVVNRRTGDDISDAFNVGCFAAGTLVETSSGKKAIETIEAGEYVRCANPYENEWGWCAVNQPLVKEYSGKMFSITVGEEVIEATDEHPFWVVDGERLFDRPSASENTSEPDVAASDNGRWVRAEDLRVGDLLRQETGDLQSIRSIDSKIANTTVYNLDTDNWSTFTVGSDSMLVHNNNCAPDAPSNPSTSSSTTPSTATSPTIPPHGTELGCGSYGCAQVHNGSVVKTTKETVSIEQVPVSTTSAERAALARQSTDQNNSISNAGFPVPQQSVVNVNGEVGVQMDFVGGINHDSADWAAGGVKVTAMDNMRNMVARARNQFPDLKIDDNPENFRFDSQTGEITAWIDPTHPDIFSTEVASLGSRYVGNGIKNPGDIADVTELMKSPDSASFVQDWTDKGFEIVKQGDETFVVKPNTNGEIPDDVNWIN